MKIHFISGLGADEKVFRYLNLPNIEKVFVKWLAPSPTESIVSYATKLLPQVETDKPIILLGVSFGGIIAQEMAKLIPCKKVIIISSVKSSRELGWQLVLARKTGFYRLLPATVLKRANGIADYYFGTRTKGESLLLKRIMRDTDDNFMEWAIKQLMHWDNGHTVNNLIHIHGTDDKIFPYYAIKGCIPIKGGSHFMIVNKAQEISSLILKTMPS